MSKRKCVPAGVSSFPFEGPFMGGVMFLTRDDTNIFSFSSLQCFTVDPSDRTSIALHIHI
jgi:hypothetical protein